MFEIKSPKIFLRRLIIVELLLGLGLIAVGSLTLINLYIHVYINHRFYKYTLLSLIFRLVLIIAGLCEFCSFLLLKKSNHYGLEISMISLLILAGNFLYLSVFIFVYGLMQAFTGAELVIYSAQFGLSCAVVLISLYVFLIILKIEKI